MKDAMKGIPTPIHFQELATGLHSRNSSVAIVRVDNKIELEIMQRKKDSILFTANDAVLLRAFLIKHYPIENSDRIMTLPLM